MSGTTTAVAGPVDALVRELAQVLGDGGVATALRTRERASLDGATMSPVVVDLLPLGQADARTVLPSEDDEQGLYRNTDALSRKAAQVAAHPAAALVLRWPEALRRLVVSGPVAPAPAEGCARAYRRRTPYLRRLAWVNTAGLAALPRAERRTRWAAFAAERADEGLQRPVLAG